MASLFGFKFGKDSQGGSSSEQLTSFQPDRDVTADTVLFGNMIPGAEFSSWNMFGYLEQNDEYSLITNYREVATSAEVDEALQEIRNEIFTFDVVDKKAIELEVNEDYDIPKKIREKIVEEFNNVYEIVEFDHKGVQYFDDWYVDGKLYAYKIIDEKNPKLGIQKIQIIDPFQIRKVSIIPNLNPDGTFNAAEIKEYFAYSNFDRNKYPLGNTIRLMHGQGFVGMQINTEAITYVHSGNFDRSLGRYVGYLKKAIIPYNNLKMMEDSMVIFRVVRAPSRRAIYIDVAGLQKNKAEQYMKEMMEKHRKKMTYDASTGTLSDRRNVLSMLEDYWLPRRTEGKTTEITTLEGQNTNDILEEVEYNRDKLWRALNVPRGRFGEQAQNFIFGKGTEIQRDEYRFKKYLNLLRSRFIVFFEDILRTQLILKKVISPDEWDDIRKSLVWSYTEDNAFVEYKETEILRNRLDNLSAIEPIIGKYRSAEWAMKNILKMTDEEIKEEQAKIKEEKAAGLYGDQGMELGMGEPSGANTNPDNPGSTNGEEPEEKSEVSSTRREVTING